MDEKAPRGEMNGGGCSELVVVLPRAHARCQDRDLMLMGL